MNGERGGCLGKEVVYGSLDLSYMGIDKIEMAGFPDLFEGCRGSKVESHGLAVWLVCFKGGYLGCAKARRKTTMSDEYPMGWQVARFFPGDILHAQRPEEITMSDDLARPRAVRESRAMGLEIVRESIASVNPIRSYSLESPLLLRVCCDNAPSAAASVHGHQFSC